MPPKKSTPAGAKKPAATAKQPTAAGSAEPKAPIDRNALVTSHTSPAIVKKAFQKLVKLFNALAEDMDEPLNPRIKAEILDRAGFDLLTKKLSNAITKYVLFVCQEGSMTTIESQTQILLNSVRAMTVAVRARLKDAGLTLQISLVQVGTEILESMALLMSDLADQVSLEWKKCLDSNGNFKSPLDSDGSQISQITARVWGACDKLAKMPLTDQEAITIQGLSYLSMIKDAVTEFKGIQEGEHEFPIEEEEEDEDEEEAEPVAFSAEATQTIQELISTLQNADQQAPELVPAQALEAKAPTEGEAAESKASSDAEGAAPITTAPTIVLSPDDVFSQNVVSKSEYCWVQHSRDIITLASNIISTFFTKILPSLQHPALVGTVLNLKIPGSLNQQKNFITGLERRLADIEKIAYYIDMMCSDLYSPQDIPKASKFAWFIVSKLSRLLTWCDTYHAQSWLKHVMDTPEGGMVFLSENSKTMQPEAQAFTLAEYNKLLAHHTWWVDMLVNPTLRPVVVGKDNPYISTTKLCPQNNRLHEFDTVTKDHKLTPISTWKWINFQRKELFEVIYAKKYRDQNNLVLTHFKLKSYSFPAPPADITDASLVPAASGDIVLSPHIYTETDLLDDREDVEPESDDEDEDFDEDGMDIYDDDFGLYSD